MTYKEVLTHLDNLQMHKIKLGLDAMEEFLKQVNHPEKKIKFIHVAGTNGKGSVCSALAQILETAGYRIGVYTSPHLSSIRERFRIGDTYIPEDDFARIGKRICDVLGEEQITYFEFTTALGLLWFEESEVDLVMLETGLGGRLDATNIVIPLVSVITSVSMDHEAYLGNSLAEISGEKAGIIKEKIPVVSGAIHPEVAPVIRAVAKKKEAPLFELSQDFDHICLGKDHWEWRGKDRYNYEVIKDLPISQSNLIQHVNDSLSIAVLPHLRKHGIKVEADHIRKGLETVKWPGRMEFFSITVEKKDTNPPEKTKKLKYLLDGAHNEEGVDNLANTLQKQFDYKRVIAIWGAMVDKDLSATLQVISPLVDKFIITQPDGERSAEPEFILSFLTDNKKETSQCIANLDEALQVAQNMANEDDLILVGGSLYLVGAMRQLLLGDLV